MCLKELGSGFFQIQSSNSGRARAYLRFYGSTAFLVLGKASWCKVPYPPYSSNAKADVKSSIVVEDSNRAFQAGQSPPPAFFYCSRNPAEPARSDPEVILASIARQLSCAGTHSHLLPPAIAAFRKREEDSFASGPLRIEESRALIIELVEYYEMTTIVIDALDECHPAKRHELLEAMEAVLQQSSRLVKIFISSRDDQDIVFRLDNYPNLELTSDRNTQDIKMFVETETDKFIKKNMLLRFSEDREQLRTLIINKLARSASGM